MPATIIDCEQNTPEWYAARLGIPTASEFHTVIAKGRGGDESKTRRQYLYRLAGEVITGEMIEGFTNGHMERGKKLEDEPRQLYAMRKDVDPIQVGFIRNGNMGASPDSLLGDVGLLEIKTKLPHLQIDCLLQDRLPPEHVAQVQGQLMVGEREWCDFVSYWPKLPLFVKRVHRDEKYIAELRVAVNQFNDELRELVERVRKL